LIAMQPTRPSAAILLACAALALSGCISREIFTPGNDSTVFHILQSSAAPRASGSSETSGLSVLIGPASVAKYLDQPQIAVVPEAGRIHYQQSRRWAEPLPEILNRVLADQLTAGLRTRRVGLLRSMDGPGWQYRVGYHVDQLDGPVDGPVQFKVAWWIRDAAGDTLHFDRAVYQQPVVPGESAAPAEAYLRAIEAAVNSWAGEVSEVLKRIFTTATSRSGIATRLKMPQKSGEELHRTGNS
jgi:uncharacterized lipoprotein YmbA